MKRGLRHQSIPLLGLTLLAHFTLGAQAAPKRSSTTTVAPTPTPTQGPSSVQVPELTLNEYLEQVKTKSPGVRAENQVIEGSLQTAKEGQLAYIPRFTIDGLLIHDEQEYTSNLLGGKTDSNQWILGFNKLFDSGTKAALTFNMLNNSTTDLAPFVYPNGKLDYTYAQTQLTITQPLWRNFFGKETRANATAVEAVSLSMHFSEKFKLKQILARAEIAYYRVAILRESVILLKEVLDRSQKILDWNTRRVADNLADRIDLLQAKAARQNNALNLATGLTEVHSAELDFNNLRNLPDSSVQEQLTSIKSDEIVEMAPPVRAQKSDDLKAAEQNERLAVARSEQELQKAQPELNLFGAIAYNGVDRYFSPAFSDAWTAGNPYYKLGVQFSFPIFFQETSDIRAGRMKQQLGAESQNFQAQLNNDLAWSDQLRNFNETKTRLKVADELVKLQREKLNYEKYRFNLGRTTTYQVLTFEQDYTQALIIRLRIELDILAAYAQLKTYAEEEGNKP